MKKLFCSLITALLLSAASSQARYFWEGVSCVTNVTTNVAQYVIASNDYVYGVTVVNTSTNGMWVAKNVSAADFDRTRAIYVPSNSTYRSEGAYNESQGRPVTKVSFTSATGTCSGVVFTFE